VLGCAPSTTALPDKASNASPALIDGIFAPTKAEVTSNVNLRRRPGESIIFPLGIMRSFPTLLCVTVVALSTLATSALTTFAQESQKRDLSKAEIQTLAQADIDRARRFSDIRSPNAPAFRLKATFSFVGKDSKNLQGTYTEIWVSNSQWRRETVVDNLRRVEVGTRNRIWRLDNSNDFPNTAPPLPHLMNIFPVANADVVFESVADAPDAKIPEECATTKAGARQEKSRFCFDKKTGALLAEVSPHILPATVRDHFCFYGVFRKFGAFWFPREVACLENQKPDVEAKVEEINAEPSPDPSLFSPPTGADELGDCSGRSVRPHATSSPEPDFPLGVVSAESSITLSLIVDVQGKPQSVRVRESGGKGLDESALKALRKWRFTPASCDGEPMPEEIDVQINSSLHGSLID
jgi:TonB family protein